MKVFLRGINIKKWPDDGILYENINEIPADPISRDMNSRYNTFSLWCFDKENIDDGILTVALSKPKLDTTDVIYLYEDEIINIGLELKNNKGTSGFKAMEENHYDIINMNHEALGKVAKLIIDAINESRIENSLKDELIDVILVKIENSEIEESYLNKGVKKEINKYVNSK